MQTGRKICSDPNTDCISIHRADFLKLPENLDEAIMPYRLDLIFEHQIENPEVRNHIRRMGMGIYGG